MDIGKYKQAMSYLLNDKATLKTFKLNPDAKLSDNDSIGYATGGRVGFKDAGIVNNESVKAGELLSYLKKYGINIHPGNLSRATQQYGIESPSSGKYILPLKNELPTIKDKWYKNQIRASGTTVEGRKNFEERNKLVKKLVASEKYNPSEIKDIVQKKYGVDMGNTIWKEIVEQRKQGKIIPSAREGETSTGTKKLLKDLTLLDENKNIKNILSNPEFNFEKDYSKMVNEVKDTLKINNSKANYRLARLLEAYSEEKIPSNKNIIDNSNKVTASIYAKRPFGSSGSVLYRKQQVEPGVASQINQDPNYFSNMRKKIGRLLPKENIYSTDELKNLVSSYENKTGPYSLFVQGIKKDINLDKGRTIDKMINRVEKELQNLDLNDPDYLSKREEIKNKYNEKIKDFTKKHNVNLKKGQLPITALELSFDPPKDSLVRYNELKKINPELIKGVENIYDTHGYSFKVPADIKTAPEALDFVKSISGQKLMEKASSADAARVYADPTGIGNVLETSFGKALMEKAPSFVNALGKVAKATGAEFNALLGVALNSDELKELGFSDLETIGRAAYKGATEDLANFGSMIYSAAAEAPFSNKPYFETVLEAGDRFKFAREGAKESAEKMSTKERVDKIAEYRARKKFEQDYSESGYNPPTKEEFQKAMELEKEGIFKEGLFSKKLYYEEEPKVNPLNKNIPTIFGNVPREDEEFNFANGGRIGYADGSEDPNKLIPIDPLLQDQSPTDPGRRDILKLGVAGAGLLGLGKLGLLKLGSAAKPSMIAEAVKGTTAPSWMDSLVTKILSEGTEIKLPKESGIIKKEVQFKNPETGDVQKATLTINSKTDKISVEYTSPTNVADQSVLLELKREPKMVMRPDGKSFYYEPDRTKGYRFETTESGPRVVDWDGNIEFDAEDTYKKIIDLKSDISGLKSYATEGKGINKKIAQEKKAATADVENNPHEYVPDNYPDTKYYPND